jgi:hypothetical protein
MVEMENVRHEIVARHTEVPDDPSIVWYIVCQRFLDATRVIGFEVCMTVIDPETEGLTNSFMARRAMCDRSDASGTGRDYGRVPGVALYHDVFNTPEHDNYVFDVGDNTAGSYHVQIQMTFKSGDRCYFKRSHLNTPPYFFIRYRIL